MRATRTARITAIAALALFSFTFLGSEFCFDICIGAFVSSTDVVWAQNIGLGISAVGFIAFGLLARYIGSNHLRALAIAGAFATCICLVVVKQATSETAVRTAGWTAFFLLGGAGAASHWLVAKTLAHDTALARIVGIAYALGILLQFLNNQFIPSGLPETITLCCGCLALVAITLAMHKREATYQEAAKQQPQLHARRQKRTSAAAHPANEFSTISLPTAVTGKTLQGTCRATAPKQPNNPQPLKSALWAVALVMLLACQFSTLDNVVTIANAQGTISVEQWPRLFLAASGIVAGFLFDIGQRRYMGLAMFCVALLSTCSILATEAGINPLVGLISFYLGSGCFVVFFTTTFLLLALRMNTPALWAGMGRTANNICAFALSGASLALVQTGDAVLTMFVTVILFALISITMVASGLLVLPNTPQTANTATTSKADTDVTQTPDFASEGNVAAPSKANAGPTKQNNALTERKHLAAFAKRYNLTPREIDILQAVSTDERPLKQVAEDLGISLRMVQRHLTSLYKKTNTQTRTGLVLKYLERQ